MKLLVSLERDESGMIVAEWRDGVAVLTRALAGCALPRAQRELNAARIVGLCYRSTVNVYKTYLLRRDRPADAAAQFHVIVQDEILTLEEALPLVEADDRLGFHAECQGYMFTADMLRQKLADLRGVLGSGMSS